MIFKKPSDSKMSPSRQPFPRDGKPLLSFVRKNRRILVVLALGIVLLLAIPRSSKDGAREGCAGSELAEYSAHLEQRVGEVLSSVDGVGRCRVFVTFSDTGETVYAEDLDRTDSESGKASEQRSYVLLSSRSSGLVLKVHSPSVRGVAVVCQGGDSARVKNDVTEIVCRTLGISADRVSVKKINS